MLRRAGLDVELAATPGPAMAREMAQAAAADGVDVVLVCGGDGTINEVINGLAPSHVPLGILPGGTANILAHELTLPMHPVRAARQFAQWTPRRIALGRARWVAAFPAGNSPEHSLCRYYMTVAGVGFDAEIVYKLSAWLKKYLGVTGYVIESLRQLVSYTFPRFSCRLDGIERQSTFAAIQRTRLYAGWLHLAPTADFFGSKLAVCSFPSRRRLRYLVYALGVVARQHSRLRGVTLDQCTEVVCKPADPSATIRFELDGEFAGTIPATFEVVPDALTILVPDGGCESTVNYRQAEFAIGR